MRFVGLFLLFFFGLKTISAQEHPFLSNFSIMEIQGNVYLHWTINAGNTCNGISIQRSDDGVVFSEIYNIAGVCGNISSPQNFDYTDAAPILNRVSYYRLELGTEGTSSVRSIQIIAIEENGYQVRPNPFRTSAVIHFKNEQKVQQQLEIFNLSGAVLYKSETSADYLEIPADLLQSGMHIFRLTNSGSLESMKGKLIVLD
jgi:hypothetical protein